MDSVLVASLLLIISLALLWLGAEGLVRGSASLALRFGIPPLIVGLTVVAYGTSAPELLVSVRAAFEGQGDIALGNVVGSNIFNICVILGLAALIQPLRVQSRILRIDMPLLVGVSLVLVLLMLDGTVSRLDAALLAVGVLLYTLLNVRLARREPEAVAAEFADTVPAQPRAVWLDLAFIAGGLILLAGGADTLVRSAITLARSFGLSEAVIGLTIIAAGTSMPELATSVVAALRRQADISIGNIVGSNLYNILGILGISGLIVPLQAPGLTHLDLALMLGTSVLLLPLMWTGFVLKRWEGALLLLAYAGYLWSLWPTPA
ncbi:MAG: calcium/sodium antiporter [Verrucomicrobiota bacterium]